MSKPSAKDIAIIGMSGKFPGARNLDEFWNNLANGVESISVYSREELEAAGVEDHEIDNPYYVKAGSSIEEIDLFDAAFFGINPREAESMDPQQRLFLECSWQVLEDAGYVPESYPGSIGVYAGCAMSSYLYHIYRNPEFLNLVGYIQVLIGNDKDYLTTHSSYKLNLKGPSVSIQTTCSTSLAAASVACKSLQTRECDMALAGGVCIRVPQRAGYYYEPGGIYSPDGHCRVFDAKAEGVVFGNGVGVVLLKRLVDAIRDRDAIHAIIRGCAINNDGSMKASYTAPGLDGQTDVIVKAQKTARTKPGTITYVEAHGTGTLLGDPVEISALTNAFRRGTDKKNFCAIGSVKSNMGHLDHAAGVTGLIKTVLALKHRMLPPSLNCEEPNPRIDFAASPFYVNTSLKPWPLSHGVRRAGVSAFGIGGTNVHMILEEASAPEVVRQSRPHHLLVLSARTPTALDAATSNLTAFLKQRPDLDPADVSYTSQVGRKAFHFRRTLVYKGIDDLVTSLETMDPKRVISGMPISTKNSAVAFLFPGQGAQYIQMAHELYLVESTFRNQVDFCSEFLKSILGVDLREVIYPRTGEDTADLLTQTRIAQPALFVVEYALARQLMEWGIRPQAMIGHSIGEFVAACLADCFSLEDSLTLVAERGRLMQSQPPGSMLAVPLSEPRMRALIGDDLDVAAINEEMQCVVSGPTAIIDALQARLAKESLTCARLRTSHAFHSRMMDPAVEPFMEVVSRMGPRPPQIPYVSNLTGTWITAAQATSPEYWGRHLRGAVRFAQSAETLLKDSEEIFLEVGPGQTLSSLTRRHPAKRAQQVILSSTIPSYGTESGAAFLLQTVGRLWMAGVLMDWSAFHGHDTPYRTHLPTYPFERQRYWVDLPNAEAESSLGTVKKPDVADWFYAPSWRYTVGPETPNVLERSDADSPWVIFQDDYGIGQELARRLREQERTVITVAAAAAFRQLSPNHYEMDPQRKEHFEKLFDLLRSGVGIPECIVHLWTVSNKNIPLNELGVETYQTLGFYSLLWTAQALIQQNVTNPVRIHVVSEKMHALTSQETIAPGVASLLGVCKAVPQEYPNLRFRSIDIQLPQSGSSGLARCIELLLAELAAASSETIVAYRGGQRWAQVFNPVRLEESGPHVSLAQQSGVYLITGGLGKISLAMAEELSSNYQARLALMGRSSFPPRGQWRRWLAEHSEDNPLSVKIRRLLDMEKLGGSVLVLEADVSDEKQVRRAIDQVYNHFGDLNGIIHGAGNVTADGFFAIDQTDRNLCERQFSAKVRGLMVLEKVLRNEAMDFWILLSSISSVLAGIGYVAYAAANAFMDSFAAQRTLATGVPWISVNWDSWEFSDTGDPNGESLVMFPEEGIDAFRRILAAAPIPQIVVSVSDLKARIDKWINMQFAVPFEAEGSPQSSHLHARPLTGKEYVAPRTATEQAIADVWQKVLGVDRVGVHDDFFTELSGSSLLATQLVARIRNHFQKELPLRRFFDGPTVAELAAVIEQSSGAVQNLAILEKAS